MLPIEIKEQSLFDEESLTFIDIKGQTLNLEHSLISLQKWESKWKKPFLHTKDKTPEEMLDYIKCMTLNNNVDDNVYLALNTTQINKIAEYINDEKTATVIYSTKKNKNKQEIITAEVIYYDMIALNIPPEYRKWHLNQLLTLIQVCSIKSDTNNKMSKAQTLKDNARLNAMRRARLGSKG